MDNVTLERIRELLDKHESVGIAVSANPTVDQMASALALYLSLKAINKKVSVASPTEPLVEVSRLVGIDKVATRLDSEGQDLVLSFPYQTSENGDGEIQKVSYTIENGFLNIIVKAGDGGLSFSEADVKFSHGGESPKLVFVVGTPRLSDLGPLFNPDAFKDTTMVNIDNSMENQGFGDIVSVSSQFSSVSEQIADMLLALNLPLDIDVAQNLFTGISDATENFQKPNTSYLAFEMAGVLLRKGATRTMPKVSRFEQQPKQQFPKRFINEGSDIEGTSEFGPASFFPPVNPPLRQPQHPRMAQGAQHISKIGQPKDQPKQRDQGQRKPPSDWLTPKVYKGSSNV